MDQSAAAVAGFWLGSAGNLFKGLPQFVRTAVRGHVAGLAPGAVWLAVDANVLWLSFGLALGNVGFVAVSALGTALTAGTLLRFVDQTSVSSSSWWALASLLSCGSCLVLAASGRDQVLGRLGVLLGLVLSLPQLLRLWRTRRTALDVTGVAQVEFAVFLAAQVGWTTYWLSLGQLVLAMGAAYGGVTRLITLVLLRSQQRRWGRLGRPPVLHAHGEPAPSG